MCLFVARPLWPSESVARIGDGLPIVMLALLLAVGWFSVGLLAGELKLRCAAVDLAVVVLVGWNVVAAVYSAQHDAPRPAVNMLWEWVALGVLYFLARQCLQSPTERRAALIAMISLATALAAFGLYQYFVSMPDTRAQYAADPDGLLRREGMWFPPGSVERELFEQRLQSTEPLSTFALANSLAGFLACWFVGCAAIALTLPWLADSRARVLGAIALSLASLGCCLLLTKSRSAYVATAAGIVLAAWLLPPARARTRWLFGAIALGMIVLALGVGFLTGALDWQVLSEAPKSLGYRWQYWQATAAMIADHPWLGVGPGNFADHYTAYKLATASEEISDPHNFLLELGATAGLPALAAMLAIILFVGRLLFASETLLHATLNTNETNRALRFILSGAVAGFWLALVLPWLTGGLIEAPLPAATFAMTLGIALAMGGLWIPWAREGTLTAAMLAIAASASAINMLAAGGISFPAVAGSFWLLVALAANGRADREFSLSQVATFVGWTAAIVALVACFLTAYHPVLAARSQLTLAFADSERAVEHLHAAAASDPRAAEASTALADLYLQRWLAQPTEERFHPFENAIADAVRRRPRQSSLWLKMGDGYLAGYRELGDRHRLEIAIEAYRRAALLYPHHAREHAKLALALVEAGLLADARREARTAQALDAATPHADQKLRPELRHELLSRKLWEVVD
jgi:O-antigen ligase